MATSVLHPPRSAINWGVHIFGATSFFLITLLAQSIHLYTCSLRSVRIHFSPISLIIKKGCVSAQVIMVTIALALKIYGIGDLIVNAIEWWLALLIGIYFATGALDWREKPTKQL